MALIVIPGRIASTRLRGKLLLDATNKPLILHTVEQALNCKLATKIVVASQDIEILKVVQQYHHPRVDTIETPAFDTGTERVAYVAKKFKHLIIINWQADEPELEAQYVDDLITEMKHDNTIATLAAPAEKHEMGDPNIVKVVMDRTEHAMYFSRSWIPYDGIGHKHVGAYAYCRSFLTNLHHGVSKTKLYSTEKLEQLSWIEHGYKIKVLVRNTKSVGIDTYDDYKRFTQRWQNRN